MDDCDIVDSLTDEAVWAHLEGDADKEVIDCITSHCIRCRPCFTAYASAIDRVKQIDPKRYARFHNENLAVRKLELARYCKNHGISIDIHEIRDADEYCKRFFEVAFGEAGPLFSKWWEKVKPERRDQVMMDLLEILHEESDTDE